MRKLLIGLALVTVAAAVATQPSWAQDNTFKIFGGASYVSPLSSEDVDLATVKDSVEAADQLGWTLGFEYRFNELLGLELDVVNSTHDVEFGGEKFAEIDFTPISASLNFHVINTKLIDFYVAPTATYVTWGDLEFDNNTIVDLDSVDTDNEFTYGVSVGLDIGLGERLAIFGGVRWLSVDVKGDNIDGEIAVNPLLTRLGLAVRL